MTYCDREKIRVAICQAQMEHDRETGDPCRKACSFCGPATDKVIAALEPSRAMLDPRAEALAECEAICDDVEDMQWIDSSETRALCIVRDRIRELRGQPLVPEENMPSPVPVPKLDRLPYLKPHEFLLFCSYCGNDNPEGCTDARPCNDCLAMCNIFGENGKYIREMGPPLTEQKILTLTEAEANAKEAVQAFLDAADLNLSMWEAVDGVAPNGASAIYERAKAANAALSTEPVPSRLMPLVAPADGTAEDGQ